MNVLIGQDILRTEVVGTHAASEECIQLLRYSNLSFHVYRILLQFSERNSLSKANYLCTICT